MLAPTIRPRLPDPATEGVVYFASGASAPGDFRGLTRFLHPVGVSLPEVSETVLREIEALAGLPVPEGGCLHVLVDTGAFSEVAIDRAGVHVVRPIDAAGWRWRLDTMARLTRAIGAQAYLVAPDQVGSQEVTLERLQAYALEVRALREMGARIIVAIQRGKLVQAEFDAACVRVLGFDDFTRGIPSNKDAMPTRELLAYLAAVRPARVHLLGMGPLAPRFAGLVGIARRARPDVALSCDSNPIAANVGLSNGRDGGPRLVTAWEQHFAAEAAAGHREGREDRCREDAVAMAFGPQILIDRVARHLARRGILLSWDGKPPPQQHQLFGKGERDG